MLERDATRLVGGEAFGEEGVARGAQLGVDVGVVTRRGRLALQGAHLASHLAHQVAEALEVLLGRLEAALGALLAAPVLEDTRGLLDDRAAALRARVEDRVELALADDHVLLAPTPESARSSWTSRSRQVVPLIAYSDSPLRNRVREMVTSAPSMEPARGVVDRERDLRAAQRGARGRAHEDHVVHARTAQRPGALGPQDPGDRVDDVGLARPVGPHHGGDPGLEFQVGGVGEGLEALHRQTLEKHG